jgi:hypothetical protein
VNVIETSRNEDLVPTANDGGDNGYCHKRSASA